MLSKDKCLVFNFSYSWAKETVKQKGSVKTNVVETFLFIFSGSGGVEKSCLINLFTNQFQTCSSIKAAHQINHVFCSSHPLVC